MYPTISAYEDAQRGHTYSTPSTESVSAVEGHRRSRTSTYSASTNYGALLEDFSGLSLQSRKEPDPTAALGSPGIGGYGVSEGSSRTGHHGTGQTSHAFDAHQQLNDARRAQAGAHTAHAGSMLPSPPGLDVPGAGPSQPALALHMSYTRTQHHSGPAAATTHSMDSLGLRSDYGMEGSSSNGRGPEWRGYESQPGYSGYAQSEPPYWPQQQQPHFSGSGHYSTSMPAAGGDPSLHPYQQQYQQPMPAASLAGEALPTTTSSHRYQSGYGTTTAGGSGSGGFVGGGQRQAEEQGRPSQHTHHQLLYSAEGGKEGYRQMDGRGEARGSAYAASGAAGKGFSSSSPSGLHSYGETGADRYPHHALSTSRQQQVQQQQQQAYAPSVQSTAGYPAYPPPMGDTAPSAAAQPWFRPGPAVEAGQGWQHSVGGQVGGYSQHTPGGGPMPMQDGRYPPHPHQHQYAQVAQEQAGLYGAGSYSTRGHEVQQASSPYHPADGGRRQHPYAYGGMYGSNSYSPAHQGAHQGAQQGQTSLPEALLPSADMRQLFAESQWQLLRILLVRRYASVSGNPSHASLTRENIRAAASLFGLHLTVNSIVSKPHKYSLGGLAAGSPAAAGGGVGMGGTQGGWRRGAGAGMVGMVGGMERGVPELQEVDFLLPSRIVITAQDLDRLPTADLPETALGWCGGHASAHSAPSASHGATAQAAGSRTGPISPSLSDADDAASKASGAAASVAGVKREAVPEPLQYVCAAAVGLLAAELVSQRRFKTKLCHAWMKNGGFCPRGDRCDYAHGAEEVRGAAGAGSGFARGGGGVGVVSPSAPLGGYGTSVGGTEAPAGSTAEPAKYKQRLCRAWLDTNGSYCPHADRCTFAHGVHELRVSLPGSPVSPAHAHAHAASSGPSHSALSPHTDHTGVDHDSVFSDDEDVVSGGLSGRDVDSSAFHGRRVGVDEAGRPHRTKLQLCVAWLTGAAGAAAEYAASAIEDGPQNADAVLHAVHAAGAARCASGSACPYAHGIDDLRLPSLAKLHKSVKDTVQAAALGGRPAAAGSEQQQPPGAAPGGPSKTSGSVTRDLASGRIVRAPHVHAHSRALSGADQTLLFVASGIALASLPATMVDMLRYLVRSSPIVLTGPMPSSEDSPASMASPLMPRVDGRHTSPALALSAAGQASVAVAAASPITSLLLSTLSVLHPGGAGSGGADRGRGGGKRGASDSTGAAQPLSRTIATLGVAACTCALLMTAVQLRLVDLEGSVAATLTQTDTVQHLAALYAATRARLTQSPSEPPLHAVLSSDMLPAGGVSGSLGLGPGQPPPSHMGLEHGGPGGGAMRGQGAGNAGRYGSLQLWRRGRKQQH